MEVLLSNLEQEELWLRGWEELEDLMVKVPECYLLLPEYKQVSLSEAQGWIQDAAYESHKAVLRTEYYKGKNSILISKVPV